MYNTLCVKTKCQMIYSILLIFTFLISTFFFKRAAGNLDIRRLNMISWIFYLDIMAYTFIASALVIFELDNHYMINEVKSFEIKEKAFFAVQYGICMLSFSMWATSSLWKRIFKTADIQIFTTKKLTTSLTQKDNAIRYVIYFFSLVCIVSILIMFYNIGGIPILGILKGLSSEQLAFNRIDVSTNYSGNQYLRNIIALNLTPMLAYILYAYYQLFRRKTDLVWFLIMFFFSVLASTFDMSKSPLVFFLIGFFFINVILNIEVSYWAFFKKFGGYFVVLIVIYISITGHDKIKELFFIHNHGITGRIILSQACGTYLMFNSYPDMLPHIGWSSLSSFFSSIFNIDNVERSARQIQYIYNMYYVERGTTGVINTFFIGEAWANFGIIGVLLAPLYVGFIIQSLFMYILKSKKTPLAIGIYGFYCIRSSVTGGVNDYIYNMINFSLIVIIIVIYLTAKGISNK